MRAIALLLLLLSGSIADAQTVSYGPPPVVDTSQFATVGQANAAVAAAVTAQTTANSVQSNLPLPCGTVPLPDTLNGSTSATNCFVPNNATRPTVVQAATVTTDATGVWSVTWSKAFASSTPYINPQAVNVSGSQPYICNVATTTTTTASGKCWQTVTTTLPSVALSLLGLVLNPTGAAASIQVRVAARDTTQ